MASRPGMGNRVAISAHTRRRWAIGVRTVSMPMREASRTMKGKTDDSKELPPVNPLAATAAP